MSWYSNSLPGVRAAPSRESDLETLASGWSSPGAAAARASFSTLLPFGARVGSGAFVDGELTGGEATRVGSESGFATASFDACDGVGDALGGADGVGSGVAVAVGDAERATEIIRTQWLTLLLQSSAPQAAELVNRLPEPWARDPEVLLAHACCLHVAGNAEGARLRYDRARAALAADAGSTRRVSSMQALADIFVAHDSAILAEAADQALESFRALGELPDAVRACVLFVVGWTKMRLRRDPADAALLLALAATECDRAGLGQIAARARANLAFATAFAGDLVAAHGILDRDAPPADDETGWQAYDGGLDVFTRGFIAYWRHDLRDAERHFRDTAMVAPDKGYTDLSRVYLALLAAERGDLLQVRRAAQALGRVPDHELSGVPWDTYRGVCTAVLHAARGEVGRALGALESVTLTADVPMMVVVVARLLVRAGRFDDAVVTLGLLPETQASFIHAGALVTRALVEAAQGRTESAHTLLEAALDAAEPQGVRTPFAAPDKDVATLLRAHASRGTRHEQLVAQCLAEQSARPTVEALSPREREVLAYLRTPMTNAEIAGAMFVSSNTLKTHQRTLFRKLGVTSRRDAVRLGPAEPGVGVPAR